MKESCLREGIDDDRVTESYNYEADTQIKRITTHRTIPGVIGELEGELNLRMYFPQELDTLITCNGFDIGHKYGYYDE